MQALLNAIRNIVLLIIIGFGTLYILAVLIEPERREMSTPVRGK